MHRRTHRRGRRIGGGFLLSRSRTSRRGLCMRRCPYRLLAGLWRGRASCPRGRARPASAPSRRPFPANRRARPYLCFRHAVRVVGWVRSRGRGFRSPLPPRKPPTRIARRVAPRAARATPPPTAAAAEACPRAAHDAVHGLIVCRLCVTDRYLHALLSALKTSIQEEPQPVRGGGSGLHGA